MEVVTENLSLTEISPSVTKIITNFLDEKYGQQNYKYKIQEAAEKGDNYMGVVYRITITVKNSKENKLILKVPPKNPLRRKQFFARAGFLREALAYDKFLPMVRTFQASKNLNEKETFFEYPQCYFTATDELSETIAMSDLKVDGFHMHNRFEPLSLDYVILTMRVYAKLHAVSLVIKDQCPEKLNEFKVIEDIFEQRRDDVQLNDYFESLKETALKSLDKDKDYYYWKKLHLYFKSSLFYDLLLAKLNSKSSEPYSVVCHGDCWINNVMFKEVNGVVVDVRLIDWQIMRYASPITDLMYFLMSSTTREFRQQHFQKVLDVYHITAQEHIYRMGSDPEKLYPRSGFDAEFKNKGSIGLLLGMIVLPILTTKSEDVPDLEKLSEKVCAGQSTDAMEAGFVGAKSKLFQQRLRGIIMDAIDWNLI